MRRTTPSKVVVSFQVNENVTRNQKTSPSNVPVAQERGVNVEFSANGSLFVLCSKKCLL